LFELSKDDRRNIAEDIKTVELGGPMGMPVCRSLGGGLYEVRSTLTSHRTARIVFCIKESRMVLLHGFIKKTQKTPDYELEIARRRQKEIITMSTKHKHIGSSFDDFLRAEETLEEVEDIAIKRILAWELEKTMKEKHISKVEMARRMHTSRSALNRLLDPKNTSVTLDTMRRGAAALGKRLHLNLSNL
jgi:phage-related protein/predicted XRE-type DNA-binding protein